MFPVACFPKSNPRGGSSVEPLDDYTANLIAMPCLTRRLLASWKNPLVRVRRASDNAEEDFGADSDGLLDTAALTTWAGGNWFVRWVYDQSGNSRHIGQSSAANQPQGGIDGNGCAYCYAPGAGFTTTNLAASGLNINVTDSTHWSVAGSTGFGTSMMLMRDNALFTERRYNNFSNSMSVSVSGIGTEAALGGTNAGLYSATLRVHSGGNKITAAGASATGTKASAAFNIGLIGFGFGGGGSFWAQNSPFYGGALWSSDLGDTVVSELQTLSETLFDVQ